jgi:hypothetical protein
LRVTGAPFPAPPEILQPFQTVMFVSGALATVGLLARPSMVVYALCTLYMGAAESSWGAVNHHAHLGALLLVSVAVAPGSTAWSLDKLIVHLYRRFRGQATEGALAALRGPIVPRWGTKLAVALLCTAYFFGGFSKMRFSDLRWVDGKTMAHYAALPSLEYQEYRQEFAGPSSADKELAWRDGYGVEFYLFRPFPTDLGRQLAPIPWVMALIATLVILFELSVPLALIGPRFQFVMLGSAVLFHFGSLAVIGIFFDTWVFACLALMPWGVGLRPVGRFVRALFGRLRALRGADPRVSLPAGGDS